MKNTTKIIILLGVALLAVATLLVVSLVQGNLKKEETTAPSYSLQATKAPSTTAVTESWVDLSQMASELATATDTTDPSDTTTDTTVAPVIQTTIVYIVYSETNVNPTNQVTLEEDEPEMLEYKYTVDKTTGGVTINKYLGDDSVVWIPEKIAGYTVTAIGNQCFEKQSLKSVVIPESVTFIGNKAFQGCKNLTSVTFKGAPSKITVGNSAFQDCVKLNTINLPAANKIGALAFDGCTSLEKLSIKLGTQEIGDYCFRNCSNLKELEIPDSVSIIGQAPFGGCSDDLVIVCVQGSFADDIVKKYGIKTDYIG